MPEVTSLDNEEIHRVAVMLARAFLDDPVAAYLFVSRHREERLTKFFSLQLRHNYLARGVVFVTPNRDAAALCMPPRPKVLTGMDRLAFRAIPLMTRSRMIAAQRLGYQLSRLHPSAPHYYLGTLGTEPDVQGHGLGSALLSELLGRCDALQTPVYLECSRVENVSFYSRFGFTSMIASFESAGIHGVSLGDREAEWFWTISIRWDRSDPVGVAAVVKDDLGQDLEHRSDRSTGKTSSTLGETNDARSQTFDRDERPLIDEIGGNSASGKD